MQLDEIRLDDLLAELEELPADWMDDRAVALVAHIKVALGRMRSLGRPPTRQELADELQEDVRFLDVCRLLLAKGQEPAAHLLSDHLGTGRLNWPRLQALARKEPQRVAAALDELDVPALVHQHLERRWEAEDILVERYKMSRGRAIAGQRRGRELEDQVAAVLTELEIPFQRGTTFTGRKGATAKCDFAIPGREHPKVVIEAKGFEATGSKLTDFLGDILKIAAAKDYHMYFFLVTDGRGWHNRVSDLRKIVEYHQENLIDMIYTRARLPDLAAAVETILRNE
jgi:hypothetical protein